MGALMATGGSEGDLRIWDAHTGTQLIQKQRAASIRDLAFHRDGADLAGQYELVAGAGEKICLYQIAKPSLTPRRRPL